MEQYNLCPHHISRSDTPIGLQCSRRQIGTELSDVASTPLADATQCLFAHHFTVHVQSCTVSISSTGKGTSDGLHSMGACSIEMHLMWLQGNLHLGSSYQISISPASNELTTLLKNDQFSCAELR